MIRRPLRALSRFVPHTIVFVASMAVMIVELVASRLVAKYVGNSLFTWTSVIGIVLGGISLGNWLGGRMADRYSPRRVIPWVLFAGSLLTVLIVVLDLMVGRITDVLGNGAITFSVLLRSVILITVLFFLPCCAYGCVSPVMAKYALEERERVGSAVGGIYAAGSLGGIAGTFLTGYLLIPALGLTAVILLVAIVLGLLAIAMGGRRLVSGTWLAVLIASWALAGTGATPRLLARELAGTPAMGGVRLLYAKDSPYSYIQVADRRVGAATERTLRLDALIHNRYDPAHPDTLLYDYDKIFASLTRGEVEGRPGPFSTLTLGGGAFTFPTYLQRHYPRAETTVVEIDPDVVEVAHRYFDLPIDGPIRIRIQDARTYVEAAQAKLRYDIIYCDAFNAFSVPYHLTTLEFTRETAALLHERGIYLANVIDILASGRFLAAYLTTVHAAFPSVAVYMPAGSSSESRTTFVVAARRSGGFAETLRDSKGGIVATRLSEDQIAELARRNHSVALTDDHAPVDNLMAPVFLRSVR